MPSWLILIIVGAILLILGLSGVGEFLIWIGVAVLVVSLVLALVGRGRSRV
jgi:membrane protein implicated in regulation of membrane protease activity